MAHNQNLLVQIERDLLDGATLADLLRKCILLGSHAGSQELVAWAKQELRGYELGQELPSYRRIPAVLHLNSVNPAYSIKGQVLPEGALPDFARESGIGNSVPIRESIAHLEALVSGRDSESFIHMVVPQWEVIAAAIESANDDYMLQITSIYWSVAPAAFFGVLDNVRTSLTELIGSLSAAVPASQGLPTADQADNAVNVAVHGRKSRVIVTTAQSSGNSVNAASQHIPTEGEPESGWWTFGKKVSAGIISLFVVAGAIAAIIAIYK